LIEFSNYKVFKLYLCINAGSFFLLTSFNTSKMRLKNISLSYGTTVYKALSDESRVRIINLLMEFKQICISDLELVLDFTQTKTSRHIHYLKNAGIISGKRIEQWVFYQLKDEVIDFLQQSLKFVKKDQTLLSDIETYNVMFTNRELAAYKINIEFNAKS